MRSYLSVSWAELIERGVQEGRFNVETPQLAAYALLQMGVGVANRRRPPALSESRLVHDLCEAALRVVGADGRGEHTVARPYPVEAPATLQ